MKQFLKYLLYTVIFLAAFYLITLLFGDFQTSVKFGKDDALTLTGPRKTSVTVPYSDIESVELITLGDSGEKVDGGSSRSYYWGTWKNSEYGEYKLFVTKKSPMAILVKTSAGETVIFNQGDTVTTENTCHMFQELLNSLNSN